MDYKYIEQLLERYWRCETTVEEEEILRAFFQQKEIPARLLRYKPLFSYGEQAKEIKLGSDFDERILAEIERPVVKARHLTMRSRLMPLFKAAAVIVLLFTIGNVMKHTMGNNTPGVVYVHDPYSDQKSDPQMAYEGDSVKSSLIKAAENKIEKR